MCEQHDEQRALRLALLEELRRVVAFDAYAWLLTDPHTEVGVAPLAEVPCLSELPRLIRLKYLTPINRWTVLDQPVGLLRADTGDHPERSLLWRELLKEYDVSDVASLVFRDRFGCWSFLELWRIQSSPSFTQADRELLTLVAPPLTEALRRCQALTFRGQPVVPHRVGPVVLMLSADLQVRGQTPETEKYLRMLLPRDDGRSPIPAAAYNVAAQLIAMETNVDDHPPTARVHLSGASWLTLRAARIAGPRPRSDQDIAVTIEPTSPSDRTALLVSSCGLSTREAEVVHELANGADTRGIAEAMTLSEHTVQDHLKSIFAKTGARNRRQLISFALGR